MRQQVPLGLGGHEPGKPGGRRRMPDPLDGVPGTYGSPEPAAGRKAPLHPLVWVALTLTLFGGFIGIAPIAGRALYDLQGASPGGARAMHTVIWLTDAIVPLVVSIVARRQIIRSNGRHGGLVLASVLIGVNLASLAVPLLFSRIRL